MNLKCDLWLCTFLAPLSIFLLTDKGEMVSKRGMVGQVLYNCALCCCLPWQHPMRTLLMCLWVAWKMAQSFGLYHSCGRIERSSWLLSDPLPAVVDICGINQWMEVFSVICSLHVSLTLKEIILKNGKQTKALQTKRYIGVMTAKMLKIPQEIAVWDLSRKYWSNIKSWTPMAAIQIP